MRPFDSNNVNAKPSAALGLTQRQQFGRTSFPRLTSFINQAAPLIIAVAAITGVLMLLSQTDSRPAYEAQTEVSAAPAVEMASHVENQAAGLDRLASKVDGLTVKLAALSAAAEKATAPKSNIDHDANTLARSRASVEEDLSTLRSYVKDVADSVALIDAEVSDPVVLQKKLERQKAIAQK